MLFRRRPRDRDEVTQDLVHRKVYRLAETYDDREGAKFKEHKVTYSFWSSVKYTFILSFLLWWLPIFGQMIAGYVGGRRAGTPWRGVIAALIPMAVIFVIIGAMNAGLLPTVIFGVNVSPDAFLGSVAAQVPIIAPYLNFATAYMDQFLSLMQSTTSLRLDSYLITVAFAYIGGILSDQTRREIEYVSRRSTPSTTVVVEGNNSPRDDVSPRPSWSPFRHLPARAAQHPQYSFSDMRSLRASAEEEEDTRPLRSARRMMDDRDFQRNLTPRERKMIEERAHVMARTQKKVERNVRRRASGSSDGLVKRAMKVSAPKVAKVKESRQSASNDWEFV